MKGTNNIIIENCILLNSSKFGIEIDCESGNYTISDCAILSCIGRGVSFIAEKSESKLTMKRNQVFFTWNAKEDKGFGLFAKEKGQVAADENWIANSMGAGIAVMGDYKIQVVKNKFYGNRYGDFLRMLEKMKYEKYSYDKICDDSLLTRCDTNFIEKPRVKVPNFMNRLIKQNMSAAKIDIMVSDLKIEYSYFGIKDDNSGSKTKFGKDDVIKPERHRSNPNAMRRNPSSGDPGDEQGH